MSGNSAPPARRGGRFTFLLAFAAFVMSATALYQINRDSDAFRNLEEKVKSLYGDVSENLSLGDLGSFLSDKAGDVRSALFDAKNYDRAEELLGTIGDRLAAYLDQLKGSRSPENERLARELRQLQDAVDDAKASVAARSDGALGEVDRLRAQIDRLGSTLDSTKALTGSSTGSNSSGDK